LADSFPPEPNPNEAAGRLRRAPTPLQVSDGRNQPKQLKTAAELAEMIELDLARHPDC
jgi:hypothetical protein